MKATTLKSRLKSAKVRLKATSADGMPVKLTRKWSEASVKAMKKALEGGAPHQAARKVAARVSSTGIQ